MIILLVDDDPTNRKLLRAVLEDEGITVCEATDGVEALAALEVQPVDAIVSDILMPNMDGFRLCLEVRRRPSIQHLPFLFYSNTYTLPEDERLALEMGGDAFLAKPATAHGILDALSDIGRRPRREPAPVDAASRELDVMKRYSERLVLKLSQHSVDLERRTAELEREVVERRRAQEQAEEAVALAARARLALLSVLEDERAAQDALRAGHARTQLLISSSNIGLWDWDLRTNTVYYSPELKAHLGYEDHEVPNEFVEWQSRLHPEDRERTLNAVKDFRHGRRADYDVEFRMRHKDGSWRWLLARAVILRGTDSTPVRMLGSHVDITTRKQAEAALRDSESKFRTLTEESMVGVAIIQDARFKYLNPALAAILGRSRDEVLALSSVIETVAEEDRLRVADRIRRREAHDALSLDFSFTCVRKDGTRRDVDVQSVPTIYEGRPAVLSTVLDVTERKRAEAAVRQTNDRLQSLSRRLLNIQESERRKLAAELHDEIGQALTAAKINLESLLHFPDPAAAAPRLHESVAIVDRALQQVRSLSLELRPAMLDDLGLPAALRWLADQHARRTGLIVGVDVVDLDARVDTAIETACFRVAQEAFTNIVKHAGARHVTVELGTRDGQIHLVIADDGAGFEVAAARGRAAQASSLGLSSMEERATLAGGGIEWRSSPGQGTEVHAWFVLRPRTDTSRAAAITP